MSTIRYMLISIFRPLIRILLRANVPFGEVADILKWTYVDVAHKHFGMNGKQPTKSRISVITGLSRVQVDTQLNKDLTDLASEGKQWHRAAKVLTAWAENKNFLDQYGKPKILDIRSENDAPDFNQLVEMYAGGTTHKSVLDELVKAESVQLIGKDKVELIKPYLLTLDSDNDSQKIEFLAESTRYLVETIDHNIDPERSNPRFQRIITQDRLPASLSKVAESYIRKKSQELANDIDQYLEHLVEHSDLEEEATPIANIGLGIYFFKSDKHS